MPVRVLPILLLLVWNSLTPNARTQGVAVTQGKHTRAGQHCLSVKSTKPEIKFPNFDYPDHICRWPRATLPGSFPSRSLSSTSSTGSTRWGRLLWVKVWVRKKSRAIGVLTDGVGPTQSRWLTGQSTIIVKKTIGLKYFYQSFPDWLKMGSS